MTLSPEMHLLERLMDEISLGANRKDSWNYGDETFSGQVQALFYRRGGQHSCRKGLAEMDGSQSCPHIEPGCLFHWECLT